MAVSENRWLHYFRDAWRGRYPLGTFLLSGLALMVLVQLAVVAINGGARGTTWELLQWAQLPPFVWFFVSFWRCSHNAPRLWGAVARIAIVSLWVFVLFVVPLLPPDYLPG